MTGGRSEVLPVMCGDDEALFNASEVLTLTLEGRLQEGMPIPEPGAKAEGAHYVAPDAKTQATLLLCAARMLGKRLVPSFE
jgi:hypothetical protein